MLKMSRNHDGKKCSDCHRKCDGGLVWGRDGDGRDLVENCPCPKHWNWGGL